LHYNVKTIISNVENWGSASDLPVYIQLYKSLKEAIKKQDIPANSKLPPSRILAVDLKISRSTVLKSYELLLLEKYIYSQKGAGYFISSYDKNVIIKKNQKLTGVINLPLISRRAQLFEKYRHLTTDNFSRESIAFRPGLPPLDLFPVNKWKQISNNYWAQSQPTNLSYAPPEGKEKLRISIANYLKVHRNIHCDYNQIIIVSGSLHSLYLIGNSLIDKGDNIVMENPTFPRAYNLFKSLGAIVNPCNVDKNGIRIDSVQKEHAKIVYTTPSNQYPLGIKMSLERRKELLEWASKRSAIIIEDDYDHEFSNWVNPIPSIYSIDTEDRVIYQGTFNKLLHPSLRLGYMIVPQYLVEPIKAIYEQSSRFIPPSTQEIMTRFIDKNYLNLHLRNVIKTSKIRKELFINYTNKSLNINSSHDGLHLIGKIKSSMSDIEAYKLLLKNNVVTYPLSNYYISKEKQEGLVMGYSSVNKKVMQEKTILINKVLGGS
jgi:GntR family transcriptional regulator/MocR family aminotransferase